MRLAQNQPAAVLEIHAPRLEEMSPRRLFLAMSRAQLALAREALGQREEAMVELDEALDICESCGFRQLFLDEGEPLAALLARGLRARRWTEDIESFAAGLVVVEDQELVDPHTERELEVLRLVADGFTNKKTAERLFLSLATVKTHLHHVSSKLQVATRTQAVGRARQLGLV